MYKRILVAYDGSEPSDGALDLAAHLAARLGARLLVAHVIEASDREVEANGADQRQRQHLDASVLRRWRERLDEIVGRLSTEVTIEREVVVGPVAASLLDFVDRNDVDLLVAGTHGVGHVKQALFGSVSHRLLRHADCDLLFVRVPIPLERTPSVIVGIDGSPASRRALSIGGGLAAALDTPLILAHVAPPPPFADSVYIGERTRAELKEQLSRHGHELLERAHEEVPAASGAIVDERREGHVSAELLAVCSEHSPALVLVGARGSQGFAGLIVGSTTRDLLDYSDDPVLVVRPPSEA